MVFLPTLYRLFLRQAKRIDNHKINPLLTLSYPMNIDSDNYGATTHQSILDKQLYTSAKMKALFPTLLIRNQEINHLFQDDQFSSDDIKEIIRSCFRDSEKLYEEQSVLEVQKRVMEGYTMLSKQIHIWRNSSVFHCPDTNLRITATSSCYAKERGLSRFFYRILVENKNVAVPRAQVRRQKKGGEKDVDVDVDVDFVDEEARSFQLLGRR